jgi:D-alanyl-D-alanine dipeptidase
MKRAPVLLALIGILCAAESVPHDLVNLAALPNPPGFDVRYATMLNFTGEKLYPAPEVWLHKDAQAALGKVQADLRKNGLAVKVFDGYRPLSVQQKMWDIVHDERYVSNPSVNKGRHTRGTAVDVALVDLMGNPIPMPSGFDDFTDKAHRDYAGAGAGESANAKLLEAAMTAHGFIPFATEWWHYDLQGWERYPVLDIPMEDLAAGRPH